MLEKMYYCWHAGQTEEKAKEIKADSMEHAAQMAVDVWRHEKLHELGPDKVTVFVKDDEDEEVKSFTITRKGDHHAPEAFH